VRSGNGEETQWREIPERKIDRRLREESGSDGGGDGERRDRSDGEQIW
ncbi:hypothetical protein A2U01_0112842, partial [Trifolium medium]|nr:hypothetical protein [Trifolium medium]